MIIFTQIQLTMETSHFFTFLLLSNPTINSQRKLIGIPLRKNYSIQRHSTCIPPIN